jgi:16S rRNA (cytidine1402-2'-O)-methyltransferase
MDEPMTRIPSNLPTTAPDAPDPSGPERARLSLEPGLYVVSTPIGNLSDVTHRAAATLSAVSLILAEDTRVTRKLLSALGITGRLASYHDHSGPEAGARALDLIAAGEAVALVSDAGTPLVSDPGYRLVQEAIARGLKVIPVPGASAPIAALSASGLPSDRFLFAGFLPVKAGARASALGALKAVPATLLFFETGPRLAESLAAMAKVLGDRPAVVAREITKLFEEFRRGSLSALAAHYQEAGAPKGEIVVVVGPPGPAEPPDAADVDEALLAAIATLGVKAGAKAVAAQFGLSAQALYARALQLKDEAP